MRRLVCVALATALLACDEGPPTPADIVIAPNLPRVFMGDTEQLTATVVDEEGRAIESYPVRFHSSDVSVLTVSQGGLLRSVGPLGTSIVSVVAGDITAEVEARVVLGPSTLVVTPEVLHLVTGEQVPLSIQVTDENGHVIASPELLFRIADPEVAQVSPDGYVTAGEQGLTNVFVTSGGLRDQVEVWVDTP